MSKIKAFGIGLLGLFAAIAALLFQALRASKQENKRLEATVKAHDKKDKAEMKINNAVSDTIKEVMKDEKPQRGKNIILPMLIFISFALTGCATPVACLCPELQIIPRTAYEPVTLEYIETGERYCTDYEGAAALANEMRRRDAIIKGYEEQIKIYQEYKEN